MQPRRQDPLTYPRNKPQIELPKELTFLGHVCQSSTRSVCENGRTEPTGMERTAARLSTSERPVSGSVIWSTKSDPSVEEVSFVQALSLSLIVREEERAGNGAEEKCGRRKKTMGVGTNAYDGRYA